MVELREITKANWVECVRLKVKEEQKSFVATNVFSLAQSHYDTEALLPLAIYNDETMVGFVMYTDMPHSHDGNYWIYRLMVDGRYQGQGFGRAAMQLVMERLKAKPDCKEIRISHEPKNVGAATLYQSLGFVMTGEMLDDEAVQAYKVKEQ